MMFPLMYDTRTQISQTRVRVVKHYLVNGLSQRKTAEQFNVHYNSVCKWVRLYHEQGEEGLLSTYRRPWNRANPESEEKIALMREHKPGLTVRQAKACLEKEGIKISIKGIWGIWKRYGYAGFNQKNMVRYFTDYSWTKEAREKCESATRLFDQGFIDRSAEILNSIAALPKNGLLPQIPDSLLSIRRRLEKIGLLYGKIPVGSYLEQLRDLYEECHRRNLYYSALIVGIIETMALSWSGEPLKMLAKVEELKNILKKSGNYHSYLLFAPWFKLLISEGIAYTGLLKIKEASDTARTCRRLLKAKKYATPHLMRYLGQLYHQLDDFGEAEYWYLKSIDWLDGEEEKITKSLLAEIYTVKGEYKRALEVWKNEELDHWGSHSKMLRIQSMWALTKGMPYRAISLANEVLASLEKEEAKGSMFGRYYTIASAYCSLGERTRARRTLEKILPFLTKNRLEVVKTIIDILLSQTPTAVDSIPSSGQLLPTIRLVLLLKNGQYVKALKYAEMKGIKGWLHRTIFFFPEAVADLLEQGKPTRLPRAMLNLPLFRKEIPVYSVKFLGNLIVYKNQKYLRVKLTPKNTAFLIHLAIAKSRQIALDRIYKNFWPRSDHPSRNLAHLLVRIRKALRLPSHFLYTKENSLCFDCHFITDHGEYLEHLAQAKAFLVAGEWAFARTEYLHAFSLFHAAPFNKMYDDWSEDMRNTILGSLENEAMEFAEACSAYSDREKGIETLQKISKIIPYSGAIKNLIDSLTTN